jgi:hypothetical protein
LERQTSYKGIFIFYFLFYFWYFFGFLVKAKVFFFYHLLLFLSFLYSSSSLYIPPFFLRPPSFTLEKEEEEEKTSPFYSRPEKIPFFLLLLLPVAGSIPLSFLYALSRDLTSAATRSRYMRSRLPPEKKSEWAANLKQMNKRK